MKEMSFAKMEEVNGGGYCDLVCFWFNGGAGYQSTWYDLTMAVYANCQGCPPQEQ